MQGIKLESFIFDPLPLADNLVLMEVDRSAHFAPVKNANGAANDTPKAARDAVLALHRRCAQASLYNRAKYCKKVWGEGSSGSGYDFKSLLNSSDACLHN